MSQDMAMSRPGPMGWGLPEHTMPARYLAEQRQFSKFASERPAMYCRRDAKIANDTLMKRVEARMAEDGIEGGFDLRYLEMTLWGKQLQWLQQLIGSCVASGGMRAWTRRQMVEIFLFGSPETLFGTTIVGPQNLAHFAPYSYRAGRRRGGLNRGDGSFCSVHIEGLMKDGALPCWAEGLASHTDAFPEPQKESTYRQWGSSAGNALMDKFKSIATQYLLLESEKVKSAADAQTLIVEHKKPLMICSDWAFKPDKPHPTWKTKDGQPIWIYTRNRADSWAHNMTLIGSIKGPDSNGYKTVENSWGMNAHKNGDYFIIRDSEADTWLNDAECQSIGDIQLPPAMPAAF